MRLRSLPLGLFALIALLPLLSTAIFHRETNKCAPGEYWCQDRCGSDAYGDTCCTTPDGQHNLCGVGKSFSMSISCSPHLHIQEPSAAGLDAARQDQCATLLAAVTLLQADLKSRKHLNLPTSQRAPKCAHLSQW